MNELMLYLLKASLGIMVFYLVFLFTLRKETFFRANRLFLNTSLLLSLILPLFPITIITHIPFSESGNVFTELDKNFRTLMNGNEQSINSVKGISWQSIFIITYITGASIFFLRLLWQCIVLITIISKTRVIKTNGVRVVENNKFGLPFSFFNIVFINPKFHSGPDLTNILAHEKVHIREHHWFDLFIIELLTVIFWFNPFVWLFERSIKQNHEYLADEGVLAQGFNVGRYQAILINQIMGMQIIGLTNNLNFSLNKKRMTMMTKSKTPKTRAFRMIWSLPAIAILLVAFAKPSYEFDSRNNTNTIESSIQEVRNINVQGKVVDEKGTPLEGASVIIGGTTIGTISDKDGSFAIKLSKPDKLYISYVGYVTLAEDINFIEKSEKINGFYKPILKMQVGVINLEIEQMLKEKPQSNVKEESSSSTSKNPEKEELFMIVERLPEYPGGMYTLAKEIKEKSNKLNLSGKIEVGLTIDEKGNSTAIHILGNADKKVQEELVKFFLECKKWNPGMQRRKAVPVNYKITIN